MTRKDSQPRVSAASTGRGQGQWPPWDCAELDALLRVAIAEVEEIRDPAKRAVQAGRMIELSGRLADIRTDAVGLLRERGLSWSDIGWWLGVSRQRAWKLGQRRNRTKPSELDPGSSAYSLTKSDTGNVRISRV